MTKVRKLNTRAPLDRSPKKNEVERRGGLPMYIRRIANHLHAEKGMSIGRAIATAKNAAAKMCATGDLNWKGKQNVNAASRAEACAAIEDWNTRIKGSGVSKSRGITTQKQRDEDYIAFIIKNDSHGVGKKKKKKTTRVKISDQEFAELSKWADDSSDPDDPDTVAFALNGEITKVNPSKQQVFGWASVAKRADGTTVVDKQGDVLDDLERVEEVAYDFVMNSRDGGEMHVRKGVSTLIESFVSTPEKREKMGIPEGILPDAWWVGFQVSDAEVWKGVVSGKYRMFSVHGTGTRKAYDGD